MMEEMDSNHSRIDSLKQGVTMQLITSLLDQPQRQRRYCPSLAQ